MSAVKLDDKAMVPLKWLIGIIAAMLAVGGSLGVVGFQCAQWMKSVDDRLAQIEKNQGAKNYACKRQYSAGFYE